ncbi:hypothetical protein Y032_0045g1242 [Ancylostoma ceylanicum]|uniref:Uncharacterized protein n=1 Tax=Ancylostoma ceylanicum TaxID=53326 RepID=A0A016UEQ0_9BILA|nr:hypothetical protein Y032_0045g1242 [Ancylostoma ceylanicum]
MQIPRSRHACLCERVSCNSFQSILLFQKWSKSRETQAYPCRNQVSTKYIELRKSWVFRGFCTELASDFADAWVLHGYAWVLHGFDYYWYRTIFN